ncbi:MAG: histidine triad nucleotide-binding protein [Alphaproteobacteria bacterium]|nr:MAG: histidine triad nucleotide-binding protein [Alphaproteobacteria bacterium]
MAYDRNNIFAKILRGDIPCKKVFENEFALAFYDINPQAPTHVLIIPKGEYISFDDFAAKASNDEITGFFRTAGQVAQQVGAVEQGFRLISNCGSNGGQEVPHFHIHILAGRKLGKMVAAA